MAAPIALEDPGDERLGDYIGMKDADLRRQGRQAGDAAHGALGSFIAEGHLVVQRLLASAYPVRSVLVTPARYQELAGELGAIEAPVYLASQDVMNAVAGFNIHRGVLAAAERIPLADPHALLAGARRVAVLEGINDHENLGVIFRNAAAFGIDAVMLSPNCCDPLYRRTVRVSMGHVLGVAYAPLAPWPSALSALSEHGFFTVALTPDGAQPEIATLGLGGWERVAYLLGAEGPGLSRAALGSASAQVRIGMAPGVDSLNVAVAAGIAFWAGSPIAGGP